MGCYYFFSPCDSDRPNVSGLCVGGGIGVSAIRLSLRMYSRRKRKRSPCALDVPPAVKCCGCIPPDICPRPCPLPPVSGCLAPIRRRAVPLLPSPYTPSRAVYLAVLTYPAVPIALAVAVSLAPVYPPCRCRPYRLPVSAPLPPYRPICHRPTVALCHRLETAKEEGAVARPPVRFSVPSR